MTWFYSDDPVRDAERYEAEREQELGAFPRCVYCDEPIQEDFYYAIHGAVYCEHCVDARFRRFTGDYIA